MYTNPRDYEKDKLYLFLNDKYNIQLLDEELEDIMRTAEKIHKDKKLSAKSIVFISRASNVVILSLLWLLMKEEYNSYMILLYLIFNAVVVLILSLWALSKKRINKKRKK